MAFAGTPLPRAVVTGTPVRAELASVDRSPAGRAQARSALGLPGDRHTVAAFGGSLGARSINRAVGGLAAAWSTRGDTTIYHVTGRRDWAELSGRPDDVAVDLSPDPGPGGRAGLCHRLVPYEDRMPLLYAAADVVVCRAGAITVAELAVAGVPAVLVPLPGAPGDHQTANARALVDAGAAVVVADPECDAERLGRELGALLADPGRLDAMGGSARALGRPDAAERVADVVAEVVDRGR